MDCNQVDKQMDAFLDRECDAPTVEKISLHLASCERCGREWGGLLTLLRNPEPVEVPAGLRDRVVAQLEAQLAVPAVPTDNADKPSIASRRVRPWANWVRYSGALAACVGLFVSGWFGSAWWTAQHQPPTPATVQQVVVSPWLVSSMAQAASLPGPINPAIMLAQGVVPELMITPALVDEPVARVHKRPVAAPTSRPAEPFSSPQMRVLPMMPRYLGA